MYWRYVIALFVLGCTENPRQTLLAIDQGPIYEQHLDQALLDPVNIIDHSTDVYPNVQDVEFSDMNAVNVSTPDDGVSTSQLNCDVIEQRPNWQVCEVTTDHCTAVFNDGAGCNTVCETAGLRCVESFENIDGC